MSPTRDDRAIVAPRARVLDAARAMSDETTNAVRDRATTERGVARERCARARRRTRRD